MLYDDYDIALPAATISADASMNSASNKQPKAITLDPIPFGDLPGWSDDDHLGGLEGVPCVMRPVLKIGPTPDEARQTRIRRRRLLDVCCLAAGDGEVRQRSDPQGRAAILRNLLPAAPDLGRQTEGLLTGYYEPADQRLAHCRIKLSGADLPASGRPRKRRCGKRAGRQVGVVHPHAQDRTWARALPDARRNRAGRPCPDKALNCCILKDPVDVFFMQVQGSGRDRTAERRKSADYLRRQKRLSRTPRSAGS